METTTIDGITQYLVELHIQGCGEVTCRRIAERFGEDTFDVCLSEWERLTEVEGIGQRKALAMHEAIQRKHGDDLTRKERKKNERQREQTMFFGSIGVHGWTLLRILSKYGDEAMDVVKGDPYRLTELDGFGFARADKIAEGLGITGSDERRVRAGILHTLETETDRRGHCYVEYDALVKKAAAILAVDTVPVEVQEAELEADERAIRDGDDIYLPQYYWAEVRVANTLRRMMNTGGEAPSRVADWGEALHKKLDEKDPFWTLRSKGKTVQYNEQQQQAIDMAMTWRVMILTGGPGTGKTTTLKGILGELRRAGLIYKMCAPTGRAAQRMAEQTGEEAQTIHRLLEYHPDQGFRRDKANPLHCDVVVVDEASMIDILLMQRLCDAIPYGGRLIIVGDKDQLPSVGAGNVLRDLIESEVIPTVRLTQIHRQQDGSHIVENAHRIIEGQMPVIDNAPGSDFFFREVQSDAEAADVVESLVADRLPKAYKGMEVQVLSPMRKEGVRSGCTEMNRRLQQRMNPYGRRIEIGDREWRVGDRVMQTKNDYEQNLYNGDTGIVAGGSEGERLLTVRFNDRTAMLERGQTAQLQLAYAVTIHKAQGSEYDIVVIPVTEAHHIMLQRNLLYTAVTRARRVCIIVGTRRAMLQTVQNWHMTPRNTRLRQRLTE